MKEAARLWWAYLVISAGSFGLVSVALFLMSSDVRFLILLSTATCSVPMAFLAGFLFNNHLRATGRKMGGWPPYRVLE